MSKRIKARRRRRFFFQLCISAKPIPVGPAATGPRPHRGPHDATGPPQWGPPGPPPGPHEAESKRGSKPAAGADSFFFQLCISAKPKPAPPVGRGPRGDGPRAPPRPPRRRGPPPGEAPPAPRRAPRGRGPPPGAPRGRGGPPSRAPPGPPPGPEEERRKKINATTFACPEAANTRTT